tara:strand:- start:134 stop:409 length:276 start_codon:yes stop_codon:yes gene_type:complete
MKNYLIGFFLILSIAIIYLIFFSQSSLFSFFNLRNELKENKNILNTLEEQTKDLQGNIKKLKNNDLEYLDELARDKHEMSKPNEIIIFNNK